MLDTTEQTLQLIQRAKDDHGDAFRVKILKKKQSTDLSPMTVAVFDDVQAQQIFDAELWLPLFAGGGLYLLVVTHMKAVATRIGGPLAYNVSGHIASDIARHVLGEAGWKGPVNMVLPQPQDAAPTPMNVAGNQSRPAGSVAPDPLTAAADAMARDTRAGQTAVDAIRAQALLAEGERRLTAAATREADIAAQKARLDADRDAMRNERAASGEASGGMNMMMSFFKMMHEQTQAADLRAREERRQDEERARLERDRSDERLEKMLAAMNKPDPVKDALIQKALSGGDETSKQMAASMAMVNTVTGMTMQLMQTKLEMSQLENGEQESPIYKLVGRGIDVFERVMESKNPALNGHAEEADDAAESDEPVDGIEDAEVIDGNALSRFDAAIFAMKAPAVVAPLFFAALQTKEFEEIFNKAKGDLQRIAEDRYAAWAMEDLEKRQRYLHIVLPRCLQAAISVGLVMDPKVVQAKQKQKAPPAKTTKQQQRRAPPVEDATVIPPPPQTAPEIDAPEA